jgi:hypothetical protein
LPVDTKVLANAPAHPDRGGRAVPAPAIDEAQLARLAGRFIYFGHQSVGCNLLEGVRAVQGGRRALRLVESTDPGALATPGWVHSRLGQNGDPHGKLRAFQLLMDGGFGDRAELAFFKFCYVDFAGSVDPDALFASYRTTLAALEARYPRTTFVHVTAPLTTVQDGWKARVKGLLGQSPAGAAENIKRARYNELLRAAYQGQPPVFDLAAAESEGPDGTPATFELGGRRYQQLSPGLTSDGGHLDRRGQTRVAGKLLLFLAGLPTPLARPRGRE